MATEVIKPELSTPSPIPSRSPLHLSQFSQRADDLTREEFPTLHKESLSKSEKWLDESQTFISGAYKDDAPHCIANSSPC